MMTSKERLKIARITVSAANEIMATINNGHIVAVLVCLHEMPNTEHGEGILAMIEVEADSESQSKILKRIHEVLTTEFGNNTGVIQ